jgi:hypothetical protein
VRSVVAAERASVLGQLDGACIGYISEAGPSVLVELPQGMSWDRWTRTLKAKHIASADDQDGLLYDKYVHLTIGKDDTHTLVAILAPEPVPVVPAPSNRKVKPSIKKAPVAKKQPTKKDEMKATAAAAAAAAAAVAAILDDGNDSELSEDSYSS